ncbi:DNA polymerase III subunit alpha, partial [Candidatus Saccharibacteria bacterium]|nr:DNA polymerase III subunit alpha [Candidatus Saccharibacteria bacterium]
QEAHEVLLCVGTGSYLSDTNRMSLKDYPLHVESSEAIIERWGKEHPEVITNTKAISDRCDVELDLGGILIPKFETPKPYDEKSYLHLLVYRGLAWRYGGVEEARSKQITMEEAMETLPEDILERAKFELGVIDNMGFNGYFLIVSDFINWGKDQKIIFGPGRGSAAGSIVSYSLRITELDPIHYDLLFERFLNPDRISMPDIDIVIQDTRRNEVIQYCADKYGSDRVANIVTFGTMAARAAIRDVSRVLEVPYAEADRISKMVPPPVQGRHIPLATSIQEDPDLKREYESSPTTKRVIDLAIRLEGTVRSHGVHAAGVVIAPDDIVKFIPLERAQKQVLLADGTKQDVISTQYPMGPVEELGLLKMDFLGLSNLTILRNAIRIIKAVYKKSIILEEVPLDDAETYALLQRGDTTGVFQLESAGMKRYLKELKPTKFDDIIAMVALYRPGPMQFIDDFIGRKHGRKEVIYEHPGLKDALGETYGILVYQEQFMQISKDMCGFTGGQADTLRKAIGKKQRETMMKMKVAFIDGMVQTSDVSKKFATDFWKQLEAFADYCFNKSHSACYGLIAYQTAYLKANYPDSYMAALMTSDYDNIDRLTIEISECQNMGITVLPPDVNESYVEFAVVPKKKQIRFGMNAIKNVGTGAVEDILRARKDGHFKDLEDFINRINVRIVNRKALDSLIRAGALDAFGSRKFLLHNLDAILSFGSRMQKQRESGQTDLFGNKIGSSDVAPKLDLEEIPESTDLRDQLQWERELLGIYLSQHPLQDYKLWLSEQTVPITELLPEHHNKSVVLGGVILESKEIVTKNGQKMAFVKLGDEMGEIELILFPRVYASSSDLWKRDLVVTISGKISSEDKEGNQTEDIKILVDSAREVTHSEATNYVPSKKKVKPPKLKKVKNKPKQTEEDKPKRLYIKLEDGNNQHVLLSLKRIIDLHSGSIEVVLVLGEKEDRQIIKLPMQFNYVEESVNQLIDIVGKENVKLS